MPILNFPDFRQTYLYDCGATAVLSILAYYGLDIDGVKVMAACKTSENGTNPNDLVKGIGRFGVHSSSGAMDVDAVKGYIRKKIPVILLLQAHPPSPPKDWTTMWDYGHYVVAIGFTKKHIIFMDPGHILRTFLTFDELKDRWHDRSKGKKYYNYGIAVYGKKPSFSLKKLVRME